MRRVETALAMTVLVVACGPNTAEDAEGEELNLGRLGYWSRFDDVDPRAMEIEAQEMIAECMKAEGWEYTPYVNPVVLGGFELSEYDEEEYRRVHGFGIATEVLRFKELLESRSDDGTADPNFETSQGMSDNERAAYEAALYGEQVTEPTEEELEVMTDEELAELAERRMGADGGCFDEAWRQVVPDEAFVEEFGGALDDAYERAAADPRIVEAEADWSVCMAKRGHAFTSQAAMFKYLYGDNGESGDFRKRVEGASGNFDDDPATDEVPPGGDAQVPPGGDAEVPPGAAPGGDAGVPPGGDAEVPPGAVPGGDVEVAPGDMSDDDAYAWEDDGSEEERVAAVDLGIDMEKLQPLIDEEISMAVADWECGEDLRRLREALYEEVERYFIDANRDRLLEFQRRNQ